MKDFIWIEKNDCIGFHNMLLARFGGPEGLRDEGLLESALARPQQLLNYGTPNHFDLAASYAHGIVKNHPFVDGNKRSGLMTAALFLEMNGWTFHPPEEEAVLHTLALAAGELDCDGFSAWLERSCSRA
ncbi:MAG: type II toxin-antitoxin system death-on-curing family toxin [Verrucomicrobiaceae bacterium]|nr:MAG: type II toxin-antitoxin system death-on-curing family toxin [Verrucomicrobiaceae bacterium]